jgi:hypothetical protein
MYFAIAADTQFYKRAVNLIATIHKYNFDCLQEIAVFDLGFMSEERAFLNTIAKVTVYDVEKVHPDLLKIFSVVSTGTKKARGWYAWKPVILKQALDMFPYVFYLDAGISVVAPLDRIFEHIQKVGYFFLDCNYPIKSRITQRVIEYFDLHNPQRAYVMNRIGISAGVQGLSHKVYDEYVYPLYQLACRIEYFKDDGTAPGGFGQARHDQMIASVLVNMLGYTVNKLWVSGGPPLHTSKGVIPFVCKDYIVFSKENINLCQTKQYLRFKGN